MEQTDYFYLSERFAFVTGARYAVIADFETGCLSRPNEAARKIIALSEQNLTVGGALKSLASEFDATDVIAFIEALSNQGLMIISSVPRSLARSDETESRLDFLWMEVTGRCNLRCIHCYAEADAHQDNGLPTSVLRRVLDEAADLGCRNVQLSGGECTLRKDLADLIMHARSKKFELVEVFTNGTRLDEQMVKFFARNGVAVAVSLHSWKPATHDNIVGVAGSFDKTIRGLEYLLAYNVQVRCATIAMKENEQDILETMYFLQKLGILTEHPDPIRPSGRGMNVDRWPEEYGERLKRTRPEFLVNRNCYQQNRRWNSCWRGKAAITATGDVLPCVFARNLVAGNVYAVPLQEIINGVTMQRFWSLTYDQVNGCRDCEYRYFCRDCRPWPFGATGDLFAKSPRCTYDPHSGIWGEEKVAGSENFATQDLT